VGWFPESDNALKASGRPRQDPAPVDDAVEVGILNVVVRFGVAAKGVVHEYDPVITVISVPSSSPPRAASATPDASASM
jgi:hypothetical protein